jgi:anti-anti-sigma factor
MLNITTRDSSDAVILHCSGRLVRGEETTLLCAAVQHHGRTVILDLRAVDAMDAAGIGVLVSLQAAGIYLKLLNPTAQVRELLKITKLESVFEICDAAPVSEETEEYPANADPVACCAQG